MMEIESSPKKILDELRKKIKEKKRKPSGMKILNPSDDSDWKMLKYFSRMNNKVKKSFSDHLLVIAEKNIASLEAAGPEGPPFGNVLGHEWHKLLKDKIKGKKIDKKSYDKAVDSLFQQLRSTYGIELLDSDFPLYGYMYSKDELSPEVYFWQGDADAIGWYYNKKRGYNEYVIVDWKVKRDLLEFWDSSEAYGMYLHQCLVYAKLLQLHLKLDYLPSILIVPISGDNGKDIFPGFFCDYPEDCKEKIEEYWWGTELPEPPQKIRGKKSLFRKYILDDLKVEGEFHAPYDMDLKDLFDKGAKVGDLLEAFGSSANFLRIVPENPPDE